jgi:2,5-diamino-6-(ribosylamino)-4(3H)-pyrimidinone 5'-phosphate reductase
MRCLLVLALAREGQLAKGNLVRRPGQAAGTASAEKRRKGQMSRPRVVVHNTASVDGKLTLGPDVLLLYPDERWQAVAGSAGDLYMRLVSTHKPQVILEGSGSFVTDDAEPEPLPPASGDTEMLYHDFLPDAIVHRAGHRGWFTAVDSRGRLRGMYKEFPDEAWKGWHLLLLVSQGTPPEYLAYLQREDIPYLVAGTERVDLSLAMEKLASQLKVTCVLSTAGGRLNGALLRAGLVDEIDIEFFPAVIGGSNTPSLFDSPALAPDQWPTRLRLISAQVQAEGRLALRYEVIRKSE